MNKVLYDNCKLANELWLENFTELCNSMNLTEKDKIKLSENIKLGKDFKEFNLYD